MHHRPDPDSPLGGIVAAGATFLAAITHVDWIGVGGLLISGGWLALSTAKWVYPDGPRRGR